MLDCRDFQTIKAQASIFTPGLQFRAAKVMAHLLGKYEQDFDGQPFTMPRIPQVEIAPQVILRSADEKLVLTANQSRLDVIRLDDGMTDERMGELAKHFCQPRWIDDPLNRPENFELHAHKRFLLPDLFEINSWFRCKSATVKDDAAPKDNEPLLPNAILVEQDFNSLAERMDSRELSAEEIRRFFVRCPVELYRVLELYFPIA